MRYNMCNHLNFDQGILSKEIDREFITSEVPQKSIQLLGAQTLFGKIVSPFRSVLAQVVLRIYQSLDQASTKDEWCHRGEVTNHADGRFFIDKSKIYPKFTTEFFQSEQGILLRKVILTAQKYKLLPQTQEENVIKKIQEDFQEGTCFGKTYGMLKISTLHKEPQKLLDSLSVNDILFHQALREVRSRILEYWSKIVSDAKCCLKDGIKLRTEQRKSLQDVLWVNLESSFDEKIEGTKSKSDKTRLHNIKEQICDLFEQRAQALKTVYADAKKEDCEDVYFQTIYPLNREIKKCAPKDMRSIIDFSGCEQAEFDILQAHHEAEVCKKIDNFGAKFAAEIKKLHKVDLEKAGWKKVKKTHLNPLTKVDLWAILNDDRYKSFTIETPGHMWFINTQHLYIYDQNLGFGGIAKYKDLRSLVEDANNYLNNARLDKSVEGYFVVQHFEKIK